MNKIGANIFHGLNGRSVSMAKMPTCFICFISIAATLSGNLFVKQRYRCGDTELYSPGRIMETPELVNMFIVFPRVRIPISPLGPRNAAPSELARPRLDTDTACVTVVTTGRPSSANITPALYLCTACITLPSSPINNVNSMCGPMFAN